MPNKLLGKNEIIDFHYTYMIDVKNHRSISLMCNKRLYLKIAEMNFATEKHGTGTSQRNQEHNTIVELKITKSNYLLNDQRTICFQIHISINRPNKAL